MIYSSSRSGLSRTLLGDKVYTLLGYVDDTKADWLSIDNKNRVASVYIDVVKCYIFTAKNTSCRLPGSDFYCR